jgi:hypothetical protein
MTERAAQPRQRRATQAAVSRAVKGVRQAGATPGRVEIKPDGTIVVHIDREGALPLASKGSFRL